jgi:hypothetical protein
MKTFTENGCYQMEFGYLYKGKVYKAAVVDLMSDNAYGINAGARQGYVAGIFVKKDESWFFSGTDVNDRKELDVIASYIRDFEQKWMNKRLL